MAEHNRALRAARERTPSPAAPDEHMTRAELAEAVNAWIWKTTGRRYELDDHLLGKWERGVVRYPIRDYRSALRAVLGVATDSELGFRPSVRRVADPGPAALPALGRWARGTIVADATTAAEWDLINRRDTLKGAATIVGAGLVGPLVGWLEPLADAQLSSRSGAFALAEVEALEHLVATFREWRSAGAGLGRTAVVGQLADVAERLRGAPAGAHTDRVFLVAAELSKIAASMAFDAGSHRVAQQHYVTSARLAKAGGNLSFGAVALAALARQSFDLGAPEDGLAVVQLAQRGTRAATTPRLTAMLATREAWAHAQLGDARHFRAAVDIAEDAHAASGPHTEPRWLRGLDTAELVGTIGARYRDLACHDRRHARQAVHYLGRALQLRDATRIRNRAFDLVSLGRAHLLVDEADQAADTVRAALPYLDLHRPGRLAQKLADWHSEAAPFAAVAAVAEVREQTRDVQSTIGSS
ncbi:hypothetical protein [Pseudonocardia sp. MH-G8]|uniref:hypothetical protein n=1 Tax=Pseudonocardia sp. MH-G8 TaxID=1854588 RepID=UPI00117B1C0F|nr:hypothetical protein [Pseudonocardia sp. MH-G8]